MNIFYRISAAIVMLFAIAWFSWWIIIIVAIVFLFYFKNYYEIIIWGIVFDTLYGQMQHNALIVSVALLFITVFLKKRLLF